MEPYAFLERSNDRRFPPDYAGDVLLWDIDKTYLDTNFETWRGLLAIPFEAAVDKVAVPGTVPLLRALRRGAGAHSAVVPLYFVSASPVQLRPVIQRKMTLDGVEFDGICFKDQVGLIRAGRLRDVKRHVAYKLAALLSYAREIPAGARWWMFGDDMEADAIIFALFGEIMQGLRGSALWKRLSEVGVDAGEAQGLAGVADLLPSGDNPVERIFIHLAKGTSPAQYEGRRVVPTLSFVQTALVLAQLGRIRPEAIATVADHLRGRHVPEAQLQVHVDDAHHRLGVPSELLSWARR
jgi:hypothetical protein